MYNAGCLYVIWSLDLKIVNTDKKKLYIEQIKVSNLLHYFKLHRYTVNRNKRDFISHMNYPRLFCFFSGYSWI